jgi:hypothetical protein
VDFSLQRSTVGLRGGLELVQDIIVQISDKDIRHAHRLAMAMVSQ